MSEKNVTDLSSGNSPELARALEATPAASEDVRERVDEIVMDAMEACHRADGSLAGSGEYTDRILALLRTPRGEGEAMDADEMWNHWTSGHEVAALQGLRTATDDEAHRFLGMLADWQRCPMPSDHDAAADRIVRIDTTPDGDLDELVTWGHGHLERLGDHVLHLELGPVALRIASAAPIGVALRDGGDWPEIERPAHPVQMPQPDEGDTL